ncbi:MAG: erythromycin esterase family protein, partial [Rhodothermaceae bacterium]|nr:erythromycin esterase family protein [Rhodothermaceae bacterium]
LPLFEYLSETQSTQAPLKLAGMDVQPIGSNKKDRPRFLAESIAALDPVYAQDIHDLDSTFLAVYAKGSKSRRAHFRSPEGKNMLTGYEQFIDYLADQPMQEGSSFSTMLVAQQTARSLAWYIRQQTAPTTKEYVENRDQGMAENLRFIADVLYPDEKIIVWGHNFHIRHDNISIPPDSVMFPNVAAHTMGYWARSWYQSDLYTVGFYAHEGTSMDNGGNIFTISRPSAGSLEHLLYDPDSEAVFADLSQASGMGPTAWVTTPITGRYNGETPLSLIPKDQYDAIVLINTASPREMLY